MFGGDAFGAVPYGAQPADSQAGGLPAPTGTARWMLMGLQSVVFAFALWATA